MSPPAVESPGAESSAPRLALGLAGLVLALVVLNAWVSDDAYITFRVVENVLRGDGLVWNPGERVMVYTHPLWFGLLLPTSALVGVWWASVSLGLGFTVASLRLLVREVGADPWRAAVVLGAFALSKTALHYGTSGLETSLLVFLVLRSLVVAERACATDHTTGHGRVLALKAWRELGLLGVALVLTRPDAPLAVMPAFVAVLVHTRTAGLRAHARAFAPALLVLFAWVVFATIVYGSPLPNTALAKLGHGVPRAELLRQGVAYLASVVAWDPVVPAVIVFSMVAGRGRRAWVLGMALHLAYVTWIGGDFMNGRFYLVPFAIGLLVLTRAPAELSKPRLAGTVIGALALLGLVVGERLPFDPALPNARFGADQSVNGVGVADEQRYYLLATGLFHGQHPPRHVNYRSGASMGEGDVVVARAIGFLGYGAADRAIVIDPIGLADPFLARFPAARDPSWRVGHVRRALPEGYEESVRTSRCVMEPALCRAWEDVRAMTHGPLFDGARWSATWRVWTGRFDDDVDVARVFVEAAP
ncbi:MAG: hypothetical protein H6720_17385 [Sandaracinus sp.]|nr:hypothetical protein [Sandaracinus sp.]